MISSEFVAKMARYNHWQNDNIYAAAESLDEDARRMDRGAFFRSIHRTLSHLLWADTIWMSRFDGWEVPDVGIPGSGDWVGDWGALKDRRRAADGAILGWADRVSDDVLAGDLSWFSGSLGRDVTKPLTLCVAHFFNHQTHHRGQIHAMLTAAGAVPRDTDLFIMPDEG
jgi:uncharacterized damage-inducible protein DinB